MAGLTLVHAPWRLSRCLGGAGYKPDFVGYRPSAELLIPTTASVLCAEAGVIGLLGLQFRRFFTQIKSKMDPELKELSEKLFAAKDCKSLLKKHVTKEVVEEYKNTKTSLGGTLAACMRSGVANLDSGVGIYASDPEAYDVFRNALDPVIRDYHKVPGYVKDISHPAPTFGNMDNLDFGDLDIDGKYVVSTRVRVGRSVKGFAFPPVIQDKDRLELEERVKKALTTLPDDLAGTYYPLKGMDKATQQQLVEDHFLFNDHDRFLRAAGGYNDWPNGRGIFFNKSKTFLTWCNEEDHLRFISMQMGGNLAEVYRRLIKAINHMEKTLPFAHHDRYGYLTFCPSNLGTTMRASVHARIPKASQMPNFDEICKHLNLQVRGIHGEHTESVGGVYDISNKRRLGLTEYQAVCEMARGVSIILLIEDALSK